MKWTLHLSHRRYIQTILESHGMGNCNLAVTPADPHNRPETSSEDFEATGIDWQKYQYAVQSLVYTMLGRRVNIAYALLKVSPYSTNPNQIH